MSFSEEEKKALAGTSLAKLQVGLRDSEKLLNWQKEMFAPALKNLPALESDEAKAAMGSLVREYKHSIEESEGQLRSLAEYISGRLGR